MRRGLLAGRGAAILMAMAASLAAAPVPSRPGRARAAEAPGPDAPDSRAARRRAEKAQAKARSRSPRHGMDERREDRAPVPYGNARGERRRWPVPR